MYCECALIWEIFYGAKKASFGFGLILPFVWLREPDFVSPLEMFTKQLILDKESTLKLYEGKLSRIVLNNILLSNNQN